MPAAGALRSGRGERRARSRSDDRTDAGPVNQVSVEALLALPATWFNAEAMLHRLWGHARVGDYRKQEWAAFHALLMRVRAREA